MDKIQKTTGKEVKLFGCSSLFEKTQQPIKDWIVEKLAHKRPTTGLVEIFWRKIQFFNILRHFLRKFTGFVVQ